jgi:hypothetical protein
VQALSLRQIDVFAIRHLKRGKHRAWKTQKWPTRKGRQGRQGRSCPPIDVHGRMGGKADGKRGPAWWRPLDKGWVLAFTFGGVGGE